MIFNGYLSTNATHFWKILDKRVIGGNEYDDRKRFLVGYFLKKIQGKN